jgi:AcrR family transcriptional regulator
MPNMATNARSSRRTKRMQVLGEAATALNRQGVSRTSLAGIAKRVGISRAALYYYFEDREDLVFQCYLRSCEQMARRLTEARHGAAGTLEVIDEFIAGMLGEGEPEFAALSEPGFLRPEQRSTLLGVYEGLRASLGDLLNDGVKREEIRPCNCGLVASAIIGLISWVPTGRRWKTADSLSDSDLVEAIRTILHEGIAADRTMTARYVPFTLSPPGLPAGRVFDQTAMAAVRQEALLAAASWLFNLKGVDATSLDEIALRVGVTKKVIYHNMGDKQTLVAKCYRRAFRFYEDIGTRMRSYEGPRIDAFSASAHALTEASLREDIAPFRPFTGLEARPPKERSELQRGAQRLMDIYLSVFNEGRAEGSIRDTDGRAVLALLPGIVEWLPKWFDAFDETDRAKAPRELTELFRLGLRPI